VLGDEIIQLNIDQEAEAFLKAELTKASTSERRTLIEKFVLAALGSIPWIGGFISAAAAFKAEQGDRNSDRLHTQWLEEHAQKLHDLRETLAHIVSRFDDLGDTIDDRIQNPEYLQLVRKAFRIWDEASTEEKRRYIGNILVNAAGTRICSDDVIRLFLDWVSSYHESHFAVIRQIFQHPTSTRHEIWQAVYGEFPREDSAEADLYKMLIRDLSTGGVIRQARETNEMGEFVRRRRAPGRRPAPGVMKSAFDDEEPYVLTELGSQFVHYTMNEVVKRISSQGAV
jgi:hypothetical protein